MFKLFEQLAGGPGQASGGGIPGFSLLDSLAVAIRRHDAAWRHSIRVTLLEASAIQNVLPACSRAGDEGGEPA